MRLHDDWKRVIKKAWSVRLIMIAAVLSGAEVALPLLNGLVSIPRGLFAALSGFTACGAFVARLVAQRSMKDG